LRFGILILPKGRKRTAWAELLARLHKAGKAMPIKDSLKAATAIAQGLAGATRNRIEFAKACVPVIDSFVG
jgi:predicted nucleic acid-binding protein